jgi:hypothetical protein
MGSAGAGDQTSALAVGQVTHDRYDAAIVPGGCAYFGARTFAALGACTGLVTTVGTDFVCDDGLAGLAVQRRTAGTTTVFLNTYPADGPRVQWNESAAPPVTPEILASGWRNPDVLFMAPVFGEIELTAWHSAVDARVAGLGLQGFLKRPGDAHPDVAGRRAVVRRPFDLDRRLLARYDAVFLSAEDIEVFGDDRLLPALRAAVPLVSVTLGDAGSQVFVGEAELRIGVVATTTVDPTGAGDTYAAAFLFALARGDSPLDAARLGAAAASIVVEGQGGATLGRVGEAFDRVGDVAPR